MRAYRFVNELGIAADAAGRAVATAADVTDSHEGGLVDPAPAASRAGAELLRQLSRAVEGRDHERVTFEARSVRTGDSPGPGFDVGIVVSIDVPTFRGTSAAVAAVTPADSLFEGAESELDERLETLSDGPGAPFLLVVDETNVRAYPGPSVRSLREDRSVGAVAEHLYGRSLRRFLETLAEGFVGENPNRSADEGAIEGSDGALREWAATRGLDGAVAIQLSATAAQTESTLESFLGT
jgi:hypothetical protein